MSKTLAVAVREVRERWILFPAGLVLGLLPLVLPAFGVDRSSMPFLGVLTAVLLGAAAAVLMGSTMLARDAATGRLAFLFSRPVPWPAIWGGKWLGAFLLVVGTVALAAAPFMLVYPPRVDASWLHALADAPGAVAFVALLLLGIGLTNFAATAFRSRSPWLALDLALLAGGLWVARESVAPLWRWGALPHSVWTEPVALLPLGVALFAASAAQAAFGRTDVRRAHLAMSLAFWAVAGLSLATAAGYWRWVCLAPPADLDVYALARDPAGRWIYVEGGAARGGNYPYEQLIDTTDGRWATRPDPGPYAVFPPNPVLFSADGRLGVLPRFDGRGTEVVLFDLAASPPRATHVSLESSPPPSWTSSFALSPAADAVFMAHESGASIFALPSGRRVATTTIPPGWRPAASLFLDARSARSWLVPWDHDPAVLSPRAEMRVVDLALNGQSETRAFGIARGFDRPFNLWGGVVPDAVGDRLLTLEGGVHLREGATGSLLATLAPAATPRSVSFISGGRVVLGETTLVSGDERPTTRLLLFDRDGSPLAETPVDVPPPGATIGPEVAPGRVLVSSLRSRYLGVDTFVVDVENGHVVEKLVGLRPAMGFWVGPPASAPGTGPGPIQFLRDAENRVVRLDFGSGGRAIVAGPDAPPGTRIGLGW
jgi:hypothetical protein